MEDKQTNSKELTLLNNIAKLKADIKDIPEASPSNPSIQLKALVIQPTKLQ